MAAIIALVAAVSLPAFTNTLPSMRVGIAARAVERELQMARLKAVSTNRTIRVRFNCPATGQYRRVELIGTPGVPAAADADGVAAARCSPTTYPFPDPHTGVYDLPNHDGQVQFLESGVEFVQVQAIEFRPNGTAHVANGSMVPWPQIPETSPARIQVRRSTGSSAVKAASVKTIEVNGLGRIRIQ